MNKQIRVTPAVPPLFLPGLGVQPRLLQERCGLAGKQILVAGTAAPALINGFLEAAPAGVDVIVDNHDALLEERLHAPRSENVRVRLNDFANTDFPAGRFDVYYAQGTVSVPSKTKISKEIARILKQDGVACLGEFVYSKSDVPVSVKDVWTRAGIEPLTEEELLKCYGAAGLKVADKKDLSETLLLLYSAAGGMLRNKVTDMDGAEFRQNKRLILRYKHEANMYLKMGGKKHTNFIVYFLEKNVAE